MKEILSKYPKAWEKYKKYLLTRYKENFDDKITSFITDDILLINLEGAPLSATYFFDNLDMIGTYDYNYEDKVFDIKVNGEFIDVHEDHQYSDDRKEAEKTLIKYLFSKLEIIL